MKVMSDKCYNTPVLFSNRFKKIVKIDLVENNQIVCHFDNDELRVLDLSATIKDRYVEKILNNKDVFYSAKIGEFGEIYWADIAEIINLDGSVQSCEYDISPEFAYFNSKPFN